MQAYPALPYSFTPIASGPDWITATAKAGSPSFAFEDLASEMLDSKRDAGGAIRAASHFGYQGYQASHLFFGRRSEDSMIQLSGPECVWHATNIIEASSNVSRLDLQVTVWTHGETPHLAVESYNHLRRNRRLSHRAGQLTVIQSDPKGETLYVNKRSSDGYGRLYDKATESKLGEARSLWRYEVEFKRASARHHALSLLGAASVPTLVRDKVRSWFTARGLVPSWNESSHRPATEMPIIRSDTDVLRWFEDSVSITVARAVKRHGLQATLQALGLDALVSPIEKGGSQTYVC